MNMYSLHGLDELIGAVLGQVCQRWMVSSYCTPGSPQSQVPSAILSMSIRALKVSIGRPVVTERVVQSSSASTARRNGVGAADREVGVLEHHRAVGFAVEVGLVAGADQRLGLLLLLGLALDELEDVGVPALERLHLGGAAGLAA